ncbi:MAG: hypothetical protein AB1592_12940 [Pseudomonadota bacterium]
MAAHVAERWRTGASSGIRGLGLAVLAGWVVLALALALILLPARYTARADLSFDLAIQPPPATVRGIAQVLASRDLAQEALRRLSAQQVAAVARPIGLLQAFTYDDPFLSPQSNAARLAARMSIAPRQGGRVLALSFSAADPRLAGDVVRAYLDAFAAIQSGARDSAPEQAEASLPRLVAHGLEAPATRDHPSLATVMILAGSALVLLALTHFARRAGRSRPAPASQPVPQAPDAAPRVAWLDAGRGAALPCRRAAHLFAQQLAEPDARRERQLILVTSDLPSEMPATFAISLARHLSQESRVALVALDGASGELCALISDPWAPGMAEMLFGVAGFGETIHRDPLSRAHVIPPGRDTRGDPGVIGADRLGLILTALRDTYDFVIVAAPVLGAAPGASKLARLSPYVVCIEEPTEGESSVEGYAALAAQGFERVLMVRVAARLDLVGLDLRPDAAPTLSAA